MAFSKRRVRGFASLLVATGFLLLGDAGASRALLLMRVVDGASHSVLRFDGQHVDLWLSHAHEGLERGGRTRCASPTEDGDRPGYSERDAGAGHLLHGCHPIVDEASRRNHDGMRLPAVATAGSILHALETAAPARLGEGPACARAPLLQRTPVLRA